jgi:hypothetical protein
VPTENVFNAFIMPYESKDEEVLKFVSVATADWETYDDNTYNYAYVVGLLLDTKHLLTNYSKHKNSAIEVMALKIERSITEFRAL